MVPPPPEPLWSSAASGPTNPTIEVPPRPVERRWPRTVGVVATTVISLLLVLAAVASQISVPWVAFEPGSATPAEDRVTVDGAPTYPPQGDLFFLTVRVNRLSLLELLVKSRDKSIALVSDHDYFGDQTPQESRQESRDLMVRAKSNAELVALSALGYDAFENTGVRVESLQADAAAAGKLEQFDVITAIDGTATNTPASLIATLAAKKPGDSVTLSTEKTDGSEARTVTVVLGTRPDGANGGFLGITTSQRVSEAKNLPVKVSIDSGDVGGNSAGLAFTLAVIDEMTDGSLTGNNKVAVTGTMELDGTVGEVGGVAQKSVAARRAGAKFFLVPRSLENEAKRNAGSMKVIPVSNLKDALDALSSIGGNAGDLHLETTPKAK